MGKGMLAIGCAAALVGPAAAHAGFSSLTVEISAQSANNLFPKTVTSPQGDSLVVWQESVGGDHLIRFRRVRPDGSLGQVTTVSDGTMIPTQHAVAFTPGGRALIVWTQSTLGTSPRFLFGRWVETDDSMGAQITLRNASVSAGVLSPAVSGTTDGDAVVTWRNDSSAPILQLEARRVDATGTTGPLHQPPDGPGSNPPSIAPTSAGGALLAWGGSSAIKAMPVDAAGAAGAVQTPVAANVPESPELTTDGQDHFHYLWPPSSGPASLATLTANATGAATGVAQTVQATGLSAQFSQLATNAADRSLAFWNNSTAATSRLIGPGGVPSGSAFAAPADQQFTQDVAVLGDGTGILVWIQGPVANPRSLWARVIGANGAPGPPIALAGVGSESGAFSATPDGLGLASWEERPGAAGLRRVRVRQFLPPPTCGDASGTVVQGRPTRISLSCSGLQLTAPSIVSGTANGSLGAVESGSSTIVYSPKPGFQGTDSFTFRGNNRGGPGAVRSARITVGKDTIRPVIRSFRINRKRVRLRSAFKRKAKRKPAFSVRFSETATATITIQRKRGKRFRKFRTLRIRRAVTSAKLKLAKRKLKAGTYRATVVARDLAGNRSKSKRIRFRVTRR